MIRNLSKKLGAKFALTILGCSLVGILCLNGASNPNSWSTSAAKGCEKEKK